MTVLLVLCSRLGVVGAALAAVMAEASGLATGLVNCLAASPGDASDRVAPRLRPRPARAHVRDQPRHHDPHRGVLIAAWCVLRRAGRARRRRRAGGQCGAAQFHAHRRFFLDGIATAAEQLCGRSVGARDGAAFAQATRLLLAWGFAVRPRRHGDLRAGGTLLIDLMTASPDVRAARATYIFYAALAPALGVLAFTFDGIYIGATWTRDMRNLMVSSLLTYLAVWWLLRPSAIPACGSAGVPASLLRRASARCRRCAIRHWGSDVQAGHGSAVTAAASTPDRVGELVEPPDAARIHRSLLIAPTSRPAEHQPAVELQQARAGPDLGERGRAGIDAAGADQRERALDAAHRSRPACGSTSANSGRPESPPCSSRVAVLAQLGGRATVVLPTIMPSIRRRRAIADHIVELARA